MFEAQYPGICEECLCGFDEGDEIEPDGEGGYVHAECSED